MDGNDQKGGPGLGSNYDLRNARDEFSEKLKLKASRYDVEMMIRLMEIFQKQLLQICLLFAQKFQDTVEGDINVSQHAKKNRNVDYLHQILIISKWVTNFDVSNINDCFDETQNKIPPELYKYSKGIEQRIKSINTMGLSPSRRSINKQMRS